MTTIGFSSLSQELNKWSLPFRKVMKASEAQVKAYQLLQDRIKGPRGQLGTDSLEEHNFFKLLRKKTSLLPAAGAKADLLALKRRVNKLSVDLLGCSQVTEADRISREAQQIANEIVSVKYLNLLASADDFSTYAQFRESTGKIYQTAIKTIKQANEIWTRLRQDALNSALQNATPRPASSGLETWKGTAEQLWKKVNQFTSQSTILKTMDKHPLASVAIAGGVLAVGWYFGAVTWALGALTPWALYNGQNAKP